MFIDVARIRLLSQEPSGIHMSSTSELQPGDIVSLVVFGLMLLAALIMGISVGLRVYLERQLLQRAARDMAALRIITVTRVDTGLQ